MKIWQIVLLVLGVVILGMCISAYTGAPEQEAAFGNAVELQEAVVLPENEGKIVIVHGAVTMNRPAYDTEKHITLPSFAAQRIDEKFVKTNTKKDEEEWNWRSTGYFDLIGEASIGEFVIDKKILLAFSTLDHPSYEDFDPEELKAYYYMPELEGIYFSDERITAVRTNSKWAAREYLNQQRFSYKCYLPGDTRSVTLVGVQRGNDLMRSEEIYVSPVNEGLRTKAELAESAQSGLIVGLIVGALAALVCLFFAFKGVLYMKRTVQG